MLSKDAKFRIQHMKKTQLRELENAVMIMEYANCLTNRKAGAILRYIETQGGKKARR